MKTGTHWQRIAERLAESGWSWQHICLTDRTRIRLTVHTIGAGYLIYPAFQWQMLHRE